MKADEIRTLNEKMQEQMLNTDSVAANEAGFKSLFVSILAEGAAQLAEANENLKRALNPPLIYDTSKMNDVDSGLLPELTQPVQFTAIEPRATLRDQFAMAAMMAAGYQIDSEYSEAAAKMSYKWADAMLEARK